MRKTHANLPLRSLQVFEAAARHGSFTAAGAELGITQSGVSRQISDLEAVLGVRLFVRKGAKVTVTPAGDRLAAGLTDSFGQMWRAVAEARRSEQVVTLSMLPSVAARWFAPRLGRFIAGHPEIDLRVTASRHLVDFAAEGIDAAVRYSREPDSNLEAVKLGTETVQPVCSPDYARRMRLEAPDDLYRATLLHADIPEDWAAWLHLAGCTRPPPAGPRLEDDGAILQAALDHQGVALGRSLLVAGDIAAGRLTAPFSISLEASHSYWFVMPKGVEPSKTLASVKQWLIGEFQGAGQDASR